MNVQVKSSNGITLVPVDSRLLADRKIFIMLYAQAFKTLFEYAESLPYSRLPNPVHVLCDDFATESRILNFPEYISIYPGEADLSHNAGVVRVAIGEHVRQ